MGISRKPPEYFSLSCWPQRLMLDADHFSLQFSSNSRPTILPFGFNVLPAEKIHRTELIGFGIERAPQEAVAIPATLEGAMPEQKNKSEDWRTLSELASKEQDPKRLLQLVEELNEALDRNDKTTHGQSRDADHSAAA